MGCLFYYTSPSRAQFITARISSEWPWVAVVYCVIKLTSPGKKMLRPVMNFNRSSCSGYTRFTGYVGSPSDWQYCTNQLVVRSIVSCPVIEILVSSDVLSQNRISDVRLRLYCSLVLNFLFYFFIAMIQTLQTPSRGIIRNYSFETFGLNDRCSYDAVFAWRNVRFWRLICLMVFLICNFQIQGVL